MYNIMELVTGFLLSAITAIVITPLIKKLAIKLGATDRPDYRKKHTEEMPRLGGLAIVVGVAVGLTYLQPQHPHMLEIIIGGLIIVVVGVLDDFITLKPIYKLTGQIAAASVVVSSGLVIDKLTMPFLGTVHFDNFGIFLTIFWIVGVSNAINLIDGLDGLAAGVSAIGLISILIIAIMDYRIVVVYLSVALVGSCIGFLYHNFYPAKIFMGDTGALFLGYAIAVVSTLGLFKNVALFSFIMPIVVMAIPIFDTLFAIIRRVMSQQSIGTPDRKHIHYKLLEMGYSHRKSVLIIYGFSAFFGIMAIVFNSATMLASLIIIALVILGIQLIAELSGIVFNGQQPLLDSIRKITGLRAKKVE
ncbi:undecaprenyl-phosphate alpha-N-acetylglucosaminyl 1-phosphate transferase [Paraliobacillus quinghaiensis]|uniref:Undecaprenyl-phosphate alpha-N-acetylglucosaminyl 1-phosphate transferase n=1 Tax=Paraliobacillus quinghaiensis TaxID=470815 RepID=A0A917TQM0_9BACI|nr:MraY family glycosyltransferase [Paraliobacillus quinghaiensis]GGM32262.1 undecaprenyl-phosphate alpha-N-acetylglucosaminyl 1-phosphate transferase [Paraliobacillus quinghaiensis]